MTVASRDDALALDRSDPLARFRDDFVLSSSPAIYADGNSLGPPPRRTAARVAALFGEWADDLVRGWDQWIDVPLQVGDRLGSACLGAAPGQVAVCDSTTINLVKAVGAAMVGRRRLVVAEEEFPTDRYLVQSLAAQHGLTAVVVPRGNDVVDACDANSVAVLSAVNYRTGELLGVESETARAHGLGAEIVWDLCHAVGAVPLLLDDWGVRLAVGCTYKYLNAGPGAPAFVYVSHDAQTTLRQPVWGWFGQRDQFEMGPTYEPADGIRSWLAGTPNLAGTVAVDEGVAMVEAAGIDAIRRKSEQLVALAGELANEHLLPLGWTVVTPREPSRRGGHLAIAHPDARAICAELVASEQVIPDFRAPDLLRLGLSPLHARFVDVYDAVTRVAQATPRS